MSARETLAVLLYYLGEEDQTYSKRMQVPEGQVVGLGKFAIVGIDARLAPHGVASAVYALHHRNRELWNQMNARCVTRAER